MKPLEEYIEINHYFGLSKDFLDIIPKEETTKRKLNELKVVTSGEQDGTRRISQGTSAFH